MPTASSKHNFSLWLLQVLKADGTPTSAAQIATAVEFPPLKRNFDTDARSALPGIIPYPLGFSDLEMTVTFKGLSREMFEVLYSSIERILTISITSEGCNFADTSDVLPMSLTAKGNISQLPSINFTALQNSQFQWKMMVNEFDLLLGNPADVAVNKTEILYRPSEFKYLVNGTNLWAAKAAAIGITPPA
ncbi:MAG: hypothetical protein KME46_25715 [Brasilonema angustatum HA4187-MV1]|jgi:phage tail tube protein FII|nr:hypothetical protein [Brasilonema angustatum HA4187-MV1]